MVEKRSYVTGGISSIKRWEGFGIDYFLPQGTDEGGYYTETCAAIGVMMLTERQLQVGVFFSPQFVVSKCYSHLHDDFQIELNSHYADVMELCLYSAVLTDMSLDGKAFTYVNQLASLDKDLSQRHEWLECACCPPNVTRTLGYLGGYVWIHNTTEQKAIVNVHLYTAAILGLQVS